MRHRLHCAETHLFEHGDRLILLDVQTGGFFEADEVIRDFLAVCEGKTLVEMFECLHGRHTEKDVTSVFRELWEAGIVSDRLVPRTTPARSPGRHEIVHLCLVAAVDPAGSSVGQPRYMTADAARRAVDLLMHESGTVRQVILEFAGQSLLFPQLVLDAMDYAREQGEASGKTVLLRIATDPSLLNERLLQDLSRRSVEVISTTEGASTPGRVFHGSGPYSLASIDEEAIAHATRMAVRVAPDTSGPGSLQSRTLAAVEKFPGLELVDLNLTSGAAHLHPVSDDELWDLSRFVLGHVLGGGTAWIGEIEDAMAQVLSARLVSHRSPEGIRSLAVSPEGALFASADMLDVDACRLGHIQSGVDRTASRRWVKASEVDAIPACRSCWARLYCGGASRASCYAFSGDPFTPHAELCRILRRTYELAMGTCLELSDAAPDRLHGRYGGQEAA